MKQLREWILLTLLAVPALTWATGASEETHRTVPQANATFISDLQTFLKEEFGERYKEEWGAGFVFSGCTHSTVASLSVTPTSCIAYAAGYYLTEVGSVTYTANKTCWTIANKDISGNLANFTRQGTTHYLVDCASASKPSLPANSTWMVQVTTNAGSITAVTDLRTMSPDMPVYLFSELPAAGNRGRMAFVRDTGTGTVYWDNGSAWVQIGFNPMTTSGDIIVGGASGVPTRLGIGSANQVLGVNGAGSAQEYKTIATDSSMSATNSAGLITLTSLSPPPGTVIPYVTNTPPSGWLMCDGTAVVANTYPNIALLLIPRASVWGRGSVVGNWTVDISTEIFTLSGHGMVANQIVHVAVSGGTIAAPLAQDTVYYIINPTINTFQLSTTSGGSAINLTTAGTGTQSLYNQINLPDSRTRSFGTNTLATDVGTVVNSLNEFHPFYISGTGAGSTRTHEGSTTISANQALSGVHFYSDFTLNSGITITPASNSLALILYATNSITINGTIAANGKGNAGGAGGLVGAAGVAGLPGSDQAGGAGGAGSSSGGAGGAVYLNSSFISSGALTGSSLLNIGLPFATGAAGGGGGSGTGGGNGGGGGAGGASVILVAPTITLGATATINTSGANGAAGINGGGGGGGGGNIYIFARSYTDNGATFTQTGGSGVGGGANGNSGVKQINLIGNPNYQKLVMNYIIKT